MQAGKALKTAAAFWPERGHARHRRGMRHQRRQRRLGVEIQFESSELTRLRCFGVKKDDAIAKMLRIM